MEHQIVINPGWTRQFERSIKDLDIPLTDKTVIVTANGANVKLDGPWGGIRAGLSLGIKF